MGCGSRGLFYNERPVYREAPKENQSYAKKEDPLEVLKIRFVNGEITLDEYNRIKQVLAGNEIGLEQTKKNTAEIKEKIVQKLEQSIQRPKVSLKKS